MALTSGRKRVFPASTKQVRAMASKARPCGRPIAAKYQGRADWPKITFSLDSLGSRFLEDRRQCSRAMTEARIPDDCIAGVRGIAVAARRQGPERPKRCLLKPCTILCVHNITWRGSLPEKLRALEQRVEAVLAADRRSGTFRSVPSMALAAMSETAHFGCRCSIPSRRCAPMSRSGAKASARA